MEQIKINIKTTNIEMGDNLRDFVEEKINSVHKFLNLGENDEALFEVEVGKITNGQHQGKIFRSEINLKVHGNFIRTESVQENLNLAIEESVEEMIRRVRKNKEKKIDLWRRGANKIKGLFTGRK